MPRSPAFWDFFVTQAEPKLGRRASTFRRIFERLDEFDGPVTIVETGCARIADNWQGDGQSTILFDRYVSLRTDPGTLDSVDIDPAAVDYARSKVGPNTTVHLGDSVGYLNALAQSLCANKATIDCLYLDSFDVDFNYWFPSAAHHLKELCAAIRSLRKDSLVVVDDCPRYADFVPETGDQILFMTTPRIGGKGRLVAEYAAAVGAELVFSQYQAGWTGF